MIASEGLYHEGWNPVDSLSFQEIDMGDAFCTAKSARSNGFNGVRSVQPPEGLPARHSLVEDDAQAPRGLLAVLQADTDDARALRQATPFAGVVEPRERWRIWREVREGRAAR